MARMARLAILLGLAMVTAAVVATPAGAEFRSAIAGTVLTTTAEGPPAAFAFGETKIECTEGKLEGLSQFKSVPETTFHRAYNKCSTFFEGDTKFRPNDCAFILKAKTETEHGKLAVECKEASMVIEFEFEHEGKPCIIGVGEQTAPTKGVRYTNGEEGGIKYFKIAVTAEELTYTKTGLGCKNISGNGKDMTYTVEGSIRGYEFLGLKGTTTTPEGYTEGKQVSVWWE
ncbi:MAG TPA: hypothetical protein VHI77_12005 [Solirubrobacterales bacterium]|nr:hypothetical protein [Solirubrobacterales bacterium]